MKIALLMLLLSIFTVSQTGVSQSLIKAADYGVVPNNFQNASAFIRKAIAACRGKDNAILQLPGGRIDVWPEGAEHKELYLSNATERDTLSKLKSIAFLFKGCRNLTVDGNNSLIVLHGKIVAFAVLNSNNIKIKNVSFDYDRPTMSELTILSVNDSSIETAIHQDSRYLIDSGHIHFYGEGWRSNAFRTVRFDPHTEEMRNADFKLFLKAKAVQDSVCRVRFEGDFRDLNYHRGDVLTVRDPYRDNCGAFISLSKNIKLENVKMHYMHGLGILSQFSENISLFKVVVAPRQNSGRVVASFADCFHFSGCKGLVKIDSCYTSGSHDDAINVHGTHLKIVCVKNRKITVRFMHHQTYGFAAFFPDDSIAFVNPKTLLPLGFAKLKTAKLVSKYEMELEPETLLPTSKLVGDCIENLTWTPEVIIRNSRFERTSTRGVLVTTRRKVVIENNVFYHTGMSPILIADDASNWYESGAVHDVTIHNNIFENCGYSSGSGAIKIAPENVELDTGKTVHSNIAIINNTFKSFNGSVLFARSVDNLQFSNNIIDTTSFSEKIYAVAINLCACKRVTIKENKFTNDRPIVKGLKMAKSDVETDLNLILKP
jgi:hypothetical protein